MSQSSNRESGFTLTELVVSLGIIAVILTTVLGSQSTFSENAALVNLADEVSSTLFQAQAYGVGVREVSAGTGEFSAAYGLAFSLLVSGSNSAYIYFADRDSDRAYDGVWSCPVGIGSECLKRFDITKGNFIRSICVVRASGGNQCSNIGRVDISFSRPAVEANIQFFNSSGIPFNPPGAIGAEVTFESGRGLTRRVTVYNTGQISVK